MPSIHLHLLPNARHANNPPNCPYPMLMTFKFTIIPLIDGGDASAKYTGMIVATIPTPNPTINLPKTSTLIDGQKAITKAPAINRKSARKMTGFLPNLSAKRPESKEPIAAPSSANETTSSFWKSVTSSKSSSIYRFDPEMTLVLYPNKNPPNIEKKVSIIKYHLFIL